MRRYVSAAIGAAASVAAVCLAIGVAKTLNALFGPESDAYWREDTEYLTMLKPVVTE
jgi:hypothetical protein